MVERSDAWKPRPAARRLKGYLSLNARRVVDSVRIDEAAVPGVGAAVLTKSGKIFKGCKGKSKKLLFFNLISGMLYYFYISLKDHVKNYTFVY